MTVLPPRPLAAGLPESAWHDLNDALDSFPPFRVELTSIEIFQGTNVIYLSVGAGFRELEEMHAALNRGPLQFDEPFEYHPHVTLAQHLLPEQVEAAVALARSRWREFPYSHSFTVDRLTFVQNTRKTAGRIWRGETYRFEWPAKIKVNIRPRRWHFFGALSPLNPLQTSPIGPLFLASSTGTPQRTADHPQDLHLPQVPAGVRRCADSGMSDREG